MITMPIITPIGNDGGAPVPVGYLVCAVITFVIFCIVGLMYAKAEGTEADDFMIGFLFVIVGALAWPLTIAFGIAFIVYKKVVERK